jgi:hypothetical protein
LVWRKPDYGVFCALSNEILYKPAHFPMRIEAEIASKPGFGKLKSRVEWNFDILLFAPFHSEHSMPRSQLWTCYSISNKKTGLH